MQVKSEMQTTQMNPAPVHELVQGRALNGEGKKNGHGPSLGKTRPKRHNRQKKNTGWKSKSNTAERENGNLDHPTVFVDQRAEPGCELRRSPLKGIKALFQGSPHSNAERRDFQVDQSYKRPATPAPFRKIQDKKRESLQATLDSKEIKHQWSTRTGSGLSSLRIYDQNPTSGPNGLNQKALSVATSEKPNPTRDSEVARSVKQNQKKRRNRKKSKRGHGPDEKAAVNCQLGQVDPPVAYEGCPPRSNVAPTSLLQMTNRPPPIPTIEFEVKSGRDFSPEKVPTSVKISGQEMVSKIDRNTRKDTVDKSVFPRAGGVVRILQNKNRGIDSGCTQTRNQQLQRSIPQVLAVANQTRRNMENEHLNPRSPSFNGSGRVRSEVSKIHASEIMVGNQRRNDCHGPSPGASSAPIRTRVSSQDVRHDDDATPRNRRTARKPRRKHFQKQKGQ